MVQHCGTLVKAMCFIAESCSLESFLMVYSEKSLGVLRA